MESPVKDEEQDLLRLLSTKLGDPVMMEKVSGIIPMDTLTTLMKTKWQTDNPDVLSRVLSKIMIHQFDTFGQQWMSFGAFFFSVIPGIFSFFLYVERYISLDNNTQCSEYARFFDNGVPGAFAFIAVLVPILLTVWQYFKFKRFMFLRLVYPVFVGQFLGLLFVGMTSSKTLLEWFGTSLEISHVSIMGIVMVMALFLSLWTGYMQLPLVMIITGGMVLAFILTFTAVPLRKRQVYKVFLFLSSFSIIVFCVFMVIVQRQKWYDPDPEPVPGGSSEGGAGISMMTRNPSYSSLPRDE